MRKHFRLPLVGFDAHGMHNRHRFSGERRMKFSAKGRYGIRAMIDLALHQTDRPISAKTIAERQNFSADYLEQIFRQLRKICSR